MLMRLQPRPWMQRTFVVVCLLVVAVQLAVIAHRRTSAIGDYDVSREFGRRFLAGEPLYGGGLHYPYMPSAAMYFAPLALVDSGLGLVLRYAVAVACLWLTFRMLGTMVRERRKAETSERFLAGALTLVLASHYIIRDLDDGGPHLILLAIVVAGISCVWRGQDLLGGIWFGLATVLKVTPGLFLPFFLWKRRLRLAACTAAALVGWVVLPAAWMGPASWWSHQQEWVRVALGSALGTRTQGVARSEDRVQNQALKPAVMRYLVTYPEGHPLRLAHPGYVPFLNLEPRTAGRLATGTMLGLLAVCAWQWRQRSRGRPGRAWLVECSEVLILTLLLSPVTWLQHLVLMVPALYLIVADDRGSGKLGGPAAAAMCAYVVLSVVLNRELLGKETYLLLLSYHTHTLAMLLVLGVLVLGRPMGTTAPMVAPSQAASQRL